MTNLSIAIIGYGKMGREIEKHALSLGHKIICTIDNQSEWDSKIDLLKNANVAIEFSTPEAAIHNIKKCFELNIPVVTGTTGWYDSFEQIKQLCNQNNQTLFYASNFSLGVNILFEINKKLASLLNDFDEYKLHIEETHHTQKLDKPSGTAITLAKDITSIIDRYNDWKLIEKSPSIADIPIKANRIDNIFGKHEVIYSSEIDTIEIKHSAKSRKGFVKGAIMAAEWVANKKGIYNMQDMLNIKH